MFVSFFLDSHRPPRNANVLSELRKGNGCVTSPSAGRSSTTLSVKEKKSLEAVSLINTPSRMGPGWRFSRFKRKVWAEGMLGGGCTDGRELMISSGHGF